MLFRFYKKQGELSTSQFSFEKIVFNVSVELQVEDTSVKLNVFSFHPSNATTTTCLLDFNL